MSIEADIEDSERLTQLLKTLNEQMRRPRPEWSVLLDVCHDLNLRLVAAQKQIAALRSLVLPGHF